jgi:hypothetical protein
MYFGIIAKFISADENLHAFQVQDIFFEAELELKFKTK